jgi:RNA polymerase sigma factor (sigma-70 family)
MTQHTLVSAPHRVSPAEEAAIYQAFLAWRLGRRPYANRLDTPVDSLIQTYAALLAGFVRRYHLSPQDAEDVQQEVWLEVISRFDSFRPRGHGTGFLAWVFCIVRCRAINLVHKRTRFHHQNVEALATHPQEPASQADDPVNRFEEHWRAEVLQVLIELLRSQEPELTYLIFSLHHLDGRPVGEVAAATGLTAAQVSDRARRALRKLKILARRFLGDAVDPTGFLPLGA